ncbi:unnamed protein product, partial [marine sediment metagenome]
EGQHPRVGKGSPEGGQFGGGGGQAAAEKPTPKAAQPQAAGKQTDSAEFKAWFGDSKVVDGEGKPLAVYHGTPAGGFGEFSHSGVSHTKSPEAKEGYYFHPDPEFAQGYTAEEAHLFPDKPGVKKPASAMLRVYVSIKKPYMHDASRAVDLKTMRKAKRAGHDGIISQSRGDEVPFEVIAFSPNQIKSATGNRGTFDPKNPDIRFKKSPDSGHSPGWKTIGGARAFIGEDGTITAGCPGVKGEDVEELDENRDEREQRQDVAESRGIEGDEITAKQAEHIDEKPKGDVATATNPKTINIKGQQFEVKQESGTWFWRKPGGREWVAGGAELKKFIEQGGEKAKPKPKRKRKRGRRAPDFHPKEWFRTAVDEAAKDYNVPAESIEDAAAFVVENKQEFIRGRERAKQSARKLTGVTAHDIARLENSGFDHASA